MADLNTGDMIDSPALRPTATVYVTKGPHRGKKGKVRSASGDGHVLLDAHGETNPIRVNTSHLTDATDGNTLLRRMANSRRR
jgi:hypothetical protein